MMTLMITPFALALVIVVGSMFLGAFFDETGIAPLCVGLVGLILCAASIIASVLVGGIVGIIFTLLSSLIAALSLLNLLIASSAIAGNLKEAKWRRENPDYNDDHEEHENIGNDDGETNSNSSS